MALIAGVVAYWYFTKNNNQSLKNNSHTVCLGDDEVVEYKIERLGKYPSVEYNEGFIEVTIKKKNTNQEIKSFRIDNILSPSHYHPVEIRKCGVYVLRGFNFDHKLFKPLPGFSRELWYYGFDGSGNKIVSLAGENNKGEAENYYSYDFRVDPTETYVVLQKGYFGRLDYSIIVKDLKTQKDAFTLSLKEITSKYPQFEASLAMNDWTKDARYFWGNIFEAADVLAFFRIETGIWKWEVFEAPVGTMGGDALNPELGYVTYDDGSPWTGDADIDQAYREQWKKEGKKLHFYLYNLFTKEKILLEIFDDPTYFTQPQWLSDTELQYEMPGGEKRVYEIAK